MKLTSDGKSLTVDAPRFDARFDGAALTSVRDKRTGVEFLRRDEAVFPLELHYVAGDDLGADKHQSVTIKLLSDTVARIVIAANDSDRELLLRLDPATGDLCVRPNGQSARRGLVSVRWNLPFAAEAALVLPCVNGLLVEAGRDFPGKDRFPWPFRWNAQLAVAERDGASLMVHSEDTRLKFKALNLRRDAGLATLGFEAEQVGPVWDNRNAGGVEWRLNVYEGDWHAPADRYRDWMRAAYSLDTLRAARPDWPEDVTFSLQWADTNLAVLDALAAIHPPHRTLIHLARWRTSAYDVDYPDYLPSEEARVFLAKAAEMGFRVMPHFNYFCVDCTHPLFLRLRDWQIRDLARNEPQGWYWPPETHDYTRMSFTHPGLGLWRRTIEDRVVGACDDLRVPAAFLDQTLCTWNTDNGIVENMNTIEGMHQLQEEFAAIRPDLILAGEGLTEISFQRQAFAQAHIHDGWRDALEQRHVDAAHGICAYLWRGHTRLVGYYHLNPGRPDDADLGVEIYRRMGAIPSLICKDPALITPDQPAVRRLLDLASEG